jgi:hypothetical protein
MVRARTIKVRAFAALRGFDSVFPIGFQTDWDETGGSGRAGDLPAIEEITPFAAH